jgi:hypothetical protein
MPQLARSEAGCCGQASGAQCLDLLIGEFGRAEDIGEHPGFAVIDAALVERGSHQRQHGQLFGELQFARGPALGPGERGGDLGTHPLADRGTGGGAGQRGHPGQCGGHPGVIVGPLPRPRLQHRHGLVFGERRRVEALQSSGQCRAGRQRCQRPQPVVPHASNIPSSTDSFARRSSAIPVPSEPNEHSAGPLLAVEGEARG